VRDFSPRDLVNMAWAFAVAGVLPTKSLLFDPHFARRCEAASSRVQR